MTKNAIVQNYTRNVTTLVSAISNVNLMWQIQLYKIICKKRQKYKYVKVNVKYNIKCRLQYNVKTASV